MLASKVRRSLFRSPWPLALSLAVSALACRSGDAVPEAGAILLSPILAGGSTTPDELRVSLYDDTGAIWHDARVPEQGTLAVGSAPRLGTILIQPGTTAGTLRLYIVGRAGGTRVVEGTLSIAPPERGRGTFDLALDSPMLPDGDQDGVPDAIDDCPALPDAPQRGCPGAPNDGGTGDASNDAAPGNDAAVGSDAAPGNDAALGGDAGADTGPSCGFSGGCDLAAGAGCSDSAQCRSSFCIDGVCCNNACTGRCRACNQPGNDGVCLGYPAGSDPEFECTSGMTCNGAGSCGPASPPGNRANGDLCASASACSSGFCVDGVCCNSACTTACRSCGTGTCTNVTRGEDAPQCVAPMRCNPSGKCVMN